MEEFRIEKDTLGAVNVPAGAYYGAQTQRAAENFRVNGIKFQPEFIRAQVIIKRSAAIANAELGKLDKKLAGAIVQAADEILDGNLADQFILDYLQAGAGTSQNMNVNRSYRLFSRIRIW